MQDVPIVVDKVFMKTREEIFLELDAKIKRNEFEHRQLLKKKAVIEHLNQEQLDEMRKRVESLPYIDTDINGV